MNIWFEWDPDKAASNLKKHGVSFDTAIRAFPDPFAVTAQDRIEAGEYRWQTIDMAEGWLLLVVAHTIRDDDGGAEIIRIVSARRAERHERRRYEQEAR